MSIQSNINQGLSLASLLISQSPRAKEVADYKASMRKAKADIAAFQKMGEQGEQVDIATEEYAEGLEKKGLTVSDSAKRAKAEGVAAAQTSIAERGVEGYRTMYENNPTDANYEAYERAQHDLASIGQDKKNYFARLDEAKRKANERVAAEQDRLDFSRRVTEGITGGSAPRTAEEQASYLEIIKKAKAGGII